MKRSLAAMMTAAALLAAASARAAGTASAADDPFLANAYDAYALAAGGAATPHLYSFASVPAAPASAGKTAGAFGAHIKDAGGDDTAPAMDDGDDDSDFPSIPSVAAPLPPGSAGFAEGTRLDPVQTSPLLSPDSDHLIGVVAPSSALGQLTLISVKLPDAQRRLREEGTANTMSELWDAQAAMPWIDLERHTREHNYVRHGEPAYADSLNER